MITNNEQKEATNSMHEITETERGDRKCIKTKDAS